MTDDPWQDPGWLEYAKHAAEETFPQMKDSAIMMTLVSDGELDPKYCCELGAMILLDKPILAMVQPGSKVPNKLVLVADEIVEIGDMADPVFKDRMLAAIARVQAKVKDK